VHWYLRSDEVDLEVGVEVATAQNPLEVLEAEELLLRVARHLAQDLADDLVPVLLGDRRVDVAVLRYGVVVALQVVLVDLLVAVEVLDLEGELELRRRRVSGSERSERKKELAAAARQRPPSL
jgi:hypothetical protein